MFGSQAYEPTNTGKKILGPPCSYYIIQPANSLGSLWAGTVPIKWTHIKQENLKISKLQVRLEVKLWLKISQLQAQAYLMVLTMKDQPY